MTDMLQIPDELVGIADAPDVLVFPAEEGWDGARQAWNLTVDQRPAAVALPRTARDVCKVVRWARTRGLRVAAQGTGHNAMPLGELDEVVLVKTHLMRQVAIDVEAQVARVQAGVTWGEVVAAAGEHGLAALAGSSHDVGVVGYSLGGGMSFLSRRYGLAANRVLAVELVNSDGELIRADRRNHPELFWALRGGGGSFGVVTALEFELIDMPTVYAGAMFFPIERASEVLHAWRRWTTTAPDTVTSVGRLLRFPPMPDIPEPMRGRSFALIEVVSTEGEETAALLTAPLRELGPEMDTTATIPTQDLIHLHMDPPGPVPGVGDHQLLAELPAEAVDALVGAAGPEVDTSILTYEIRHAGGAIARHSAGNGALSGIDAPYVTFGAAIAMTPEMAAAGKADLAKVRAAMAPWDAGREYLNFAEHRGTDPARFYDEDAYARLRVVKGEVDPEDVFAGNHHIRPL